MSGAGKFSSDSGSRQIFGLTVLGAEALQCDLRSGQPDAHRMIQANRTRHGMAPGGRLAVFSGSLPPRPPPRQLKRKAASEARASAPLLLGTMLNSSTVTPERSTA